MKTMTTYYSKGYFFLIIPIFLLASGFSRFEYAASFAENPLVGAWEIVQYNGEKPASRTVQIFSRNYFMSTNYSLENKVFESSMGGFYEMQGGTVSLAIDYHTQDTSMIGQSFSFKVKSAEDQTATWKGKIKEEKVTAIYKRIDAGDSPLAGAWSIGRRVGQTGEMREMTPGPRKTVKILSGTRFQWTAMNTETKEFFGTGGGTYSLKDGVYTENIEFFSRDSTRVGASLSFEGKVEGDEWFHSGQSSRGLPINEVWIRQ